MVRGAYFENHLKLVKAGHSLVCIVHVHDNAQACNVRHIPAVGLRYSADQQLSAVVHRETTLSQNEVKKTAITWS